jgi:dihydrofolate reductase
MGAVQSEVLGHDVAVADEVVLFDGDRSQVVVDDAQDPRETAATLQAGRVIDHVVGDEVVEDNTLARLLATEQLLDHLPCAPSTHVDSIPPTAMSLAMVSGRYPYRSTALEEDDMTATYTFDVFSSLDGYGAASANWPGYWGKQGPELLDHRLALYGAEQRMVFGANTFRAFVQMLASSTEESEVRDPWVTRMRSMPATVVSTTLKGPLDWPNATVVSGDAVDVVARLKEESEVPLRSHGSLSMNRALMAAGLVDRVQVTLFPVITGQTGLDPIFQGAADFDLELVENRTLDGHIQELIYRPTLH